MLRSKVRVHSKQIYFMKWPGKGLFRVRAFLTGLVQAFPGDLRAIDRWNEMGKNL